MKDNKEMRDFFARDEEEQAAFLSQTWCDHCQQPDLGMHSPQEYQLEGVVYIEGLCNQCKQAVFTELTEEEL